MASEGSISHCLSMLKAGDHAAAQLLWERYFLQLVGLARSRLRGSARRAADEEDVALSVFDSFYQRAMRGQFPRLNLLARSASDGIPGRALSLAPRVGIGSLREPVACAMQP
jgi:hypothetical protein